MMAPCAAEDAVVVSVIFGARFGLSQDVVGVVDAMETIGVWWC